MPAKLFVNLKNEISYDSLDLDDHFAENFGGKAVIELYLELITFKRLAKFFQKKGALNILNHKIC